MRGRDLEIFGEKIRKLWRERESMLYVNSNIYVDNEDSDDEKGEN